MKYTFQSTVFPGGGEPDVTYDYEPVFSESAETSIGVGLIFAAAFIIADIASGGTLTEFIPLMLESVSASI